MNRGIFITIGGTLAAIMGINCSHAPATRASAAAPTSAPTTSKYAGDVRIQGPIRSITLPELETNLPPGEGRKLVVIACATCHTTRYIMHQPPLSREAWTASVNKMRTTYSAPIAEENVKPIVDYLVAVRGPQ